MNMDFDSKELDLGLGISVVDKGNNLGIEIRDSANSILLTRTQIMYLQTFLHFKTERELKEARSQNE